MELNDITCPQLSGATPVFHLPTPAARVAFLLSLSDFRNRNQYAQIKLI